MTLILPSETASSSTGPAEVRLEVRRLCKIFADDPRPALSLLEAGAGKAEVLRRLNVNVGVVDASFDIRAGEIFVIMGLSGSGKSTMVRLLNRLIEPSRGEIRLDGRDLTRLPKRELVEVLRRDMSMVFQSFALLPNRTALENAAFGLEVAGVGKAARRAAALRALEQVGLGAYAGRYPRELSGGMQQRVGLARALAKNPTIMLMDEAFSALDPLIRAEMQNELLRLQREQARTIVFISHDAEEAMRIADRIAVMEDGRIVQIGTPAEILREPADEYVRAFFRGVDSSRVLRARDLARCDAATVLLDEADDRRPALRRLSELGAGYGYVRDRAGRFRGVLSRDGADLLDGVEPAAGDAPVHALLRRVATAPCPLPVVDGQGVFLGVVSRAALLETLDRGSLGDG
ncbi:glycine betaine/proline transport system ATP-binding protein [Azospirillum agricola]|uniref:quaternary amine ABC transporter ATP-binding protein n=1 Tax=Azospirillum agricola TaxID=1720247 RepID=UPI001AE65DD3|nr:glycine betaine/L-proline ABC transporter ATP-binding protein [Azospirillum agricola]MBP2230864.1 glycine betaine/proline transport system ATP-binding protein [Azospirillum agricola]